MPVARFCDVLLGGLASDGGLVVPQTYPRLTNDELTAMRSHQPFC
jgi:threonine synthase